MAVEHFIYGAAASSLLSDSPEISSGKSEGPPIFSDMPPPFVDSQFNIRTESQFDIRPMLVGLFVGLAAGIGIGLLLWG